MEKVVGVVRNESNGGKTSHRKTIRTTYSLPRFLTSKKHPSVPQQNRNKDEILFFLTMVPKLKTLPILPNKGLMGFSFLYHLSGVSTFQKTWLFHFVQFFTWIL